MKERIKFIVAWILMRLFSLLPIDENKIVYSSYRGNYFNDSPKAIYDEMLKSDKELKHVWLLNQGSKDYSGKRVPYYSLKAIYELSTSRVWIDNCRKGLWTFKRRNQIYIQTWHGGIALKKIERDAISSLPDGYEQMALHDSGMTDIMISPAKFCTELYQRSFWYNGTILEIGYPRSDVLYSESDINKEIIKSFYGINDFKIVLYAPTFRSNGTMESYDIDYHKLISKLNELDVGKWKVLVRLHPNIKSQIDKIDFDTEVLDGSLFEDINIIISACDLFITDYSSCMFDAMEANKKVILYMKDLDSYNTDRGMYFSLEELPFPVVKDNSELLFILKEVIENDNKSLVEEFRNRLGMIRTSNSSGEAAKHILRMMYGREESPK